MSEETLVPAETPVALSFRKLVRLVRPEYGLSDDARANRCAAIERATTLLMRHPAETLDDLVYKLAVLCDRLRAAEDGSETGRLTLLVAEAARADATRLIAWTRGPSASMEGPL